MSFGSVLCAVFAAIWSVGMLADVEALTQFLLVNGAVQITLFLFVACMLFKNEPVFPLVSEVIG